MGNRRLVESDTPTPDQWVNGMDQEEAMNIYIRDGKEGDQSGIAETIAEAFYDSFKAIVKSKEKIV